MGAIAADGNLGWFWLASEAFGCQTWDISTCVSVDNLMHTLMNVNVSSNLVASLLTFWPAPAGPSTACHNARPAWETQAVQRDGQSSPQTHHEGERAQTTRYWFTACLRALKSCSAWDVSFDQIMSCIMLIWTEISEEWFQHLVEFVQTSTSTTNLMKLLLDWQLTAAPLPVLWSWN